MSDFGEDFRYEDEYQSSPYEGEGEMVSPMSSRANTPMANSRRSNTNASASASPRGSTFGSTRDRGVRSSLSNKRTRYDGLLWKMKPGIFGRSVWFQVYSFVDEHRLVHFSDKEKPRSYRIKPVLELQLENFEVMKYNKDKSYGLRFIERKPGTKQYIFACDNIDDHEFLLDLTTRQSKYKSQKLLEETEYNDGFSNQYEDVDDSEDQEEPNQNVASDNSKRRMSAMDDRNDSPSTDHMEEMNSRRPTETSRKGSVTNVTVEKSDHSTEPVSSKNNMSFNNTIGSNSKMSSFNLRNSMIGPKDNSSARGSSVSPPRDSVKIVQEISRRSSVDANAEKSSKMQDQNNDRHETSSSDEYDRPVNKTPFMKTNEPSTQSTKEIRRQGQLHQTVIYEDDDIDGDFDEEVVENIRRGTIDRLQSEELKTNSDKNEPEESVNENDKSSNSSEEVASDRFDGPLLKQKTGFFGKTSWSPKWVHIDENRFVQWTDSTPPNYQKEKPSYFFDLSQSYFESYVDVYQGKRFVFKIGIKDGSSCTYACDNEEQYKTILSIVNRQSDKLNHSRRSVMKQESDVVDASPLKDQSDSGESRPTKPEPTPITPKRASTNAIPSQRKDESPIYDIDESVSISSNIDESNSPKLQVKVQETEPKPTIRSSQISPNIPLNTRKSTIEEKVHVNANIEKESPKIDTAIADDIDELEKDFLTDENLSELSDFMPMQEDIIIDHFEKYNSAPEANVGDSTVQFSQLKTLLRNLNSLGKMFINPYAAVVIFKDLNIPVGTRITCNEFLKWWQLFLASTKSDMRQAKSLVLRNMLLDNFSETKQETKLDLKSSLLKIPIVSVKSIEILSPSKPSLDDDWNSIFQKALDIATGVDNLAYKPSIIPVISQDTSKSSFSRKNFYMELSLQQNNTSESDKNGRSSFDFPTWSPIDTDSDVNTNPKSIERMLLKNLLNFQSLMGSFYLTAIKGAALIIDEYLLPDYLKATSVFRISLTSVTKSNNLSRDVSSILPNIFGYDGLIFRIVDINTSENPGKFESNSNIWFSDPTTSCEINRKIILHEFLGKNLLTEANLRVLDRYLDISSSNASNNTSKSICKVSTLLSTVVDYAGFRLYVLAPADISEEQSLTYGFCMSASPIQMTTTSNQESSIPSKIPASPKRLNSKRFVPDGMAQYSGQSPTLRMNEDQSNISFPFVDKSTSRKSNAETESIRLGLKELYSELGAELNIQQMKYEAISTSSTAAALKNTFGHVRVYELLSKNLQLHTCLDNRRYLINTSDICPADHPQNNSSLDAFVKKFRPEYFQSLPYRLFADTFIHKQSKLDKRSDGNPESLSMAAVQELYSKRLQAFAAYLDKNCFDAEDSYSFSSKLHSYGLNCRHLGDLYILADQPASQDIIIIEAIARCCKSLLNRALRGLLKTCLQAADTSAKATPMSDPGKHATIFRRHNDEYFRSREEIISKLFNIILGSSKTSQEFWRGSLSQLFEKKFGLPLPHDHMIHYPRLFLALQYHTGAIFQDQAYSFPYANTGRQFYRSFDSSRLSGNMRQSKQPVHRHATNLPPAVDVMDISSTFSDADVRSFGLPTIKYWTAFPGPFLHCYFLGESLKSHGLYRDALSVYRTTLSSIYTTLNYRPTYLLDETKEENDFQCSISEKVYQMIAHTEYAYAEVLYLAGLYDEARLVIESTIIRSRKYSVISLRMLTSLMRVDFQLGKYAMSLESYSRAIDVADYIFGPSHAIKAQITITLAELYCHSTGYPPQAIECTIGHITKTYETFDKVDQHQLIFKISLGNRLGELYLKEKLYQEAMEELQQIQKDLELLENQRQKLINDRMRADDHTPSQKSVMIDEKLQHESLQCFYHLSLCQYHNGFKEKALQNGMIYLEKKKLQVCIDDLESKNESNNNSPISGQKQQSTSGNRLNISIDNPATLSNTDSRTLGASLKFPRLSIEQITINRILGDLLCGKFRYDSSINLIMDCWRSCVSYPRDYENADMLIVSLSYQIAFVLLASLASDSKKYLETIEAHITLSYGTISDKELWNDCSEMVVKALWSGRSKQFLTLLISNLQRHTLDGRIDERRLSREGLTFSYQSAVLVRMARQFVKVSV